MARNENAVELELFRYGSLLFGKVLSTPKKLIGSGEIASINGFEVKSSDSPELSQTTLWIHGTDHNGDDNEFFQGYDCENEAVETAEKIKFLVEEINVELMKGASAKFPLRIKHPESEKKFKEGIEKMI